jgi:hypothetical protein
VSSGETVTATPPPPPRSSARHSASSSSVELSSAPSQSASKSEPVSRRDPKPNSLSAPETTKPLNNLGFFKKFNNTDISFRLNKNEADQYANDLFRGISQSDFNLMIENMTKHWDRFKNSEQLLNVFACGSNLIVDKINGQNSKNCLNVYKQLIDSHRVTQGSNKSVIEFALPKLAEVVEAEDEAELAALFKAEYHGVDLSDAANNAFDKLPTEIKAKMRKYLNQDVID